MKAHTTYWNAFLDVLLLLFLSSIDVPVVLARQDKGSISSMIPSLTPPPSVRPTQSTILTVPPTILVFVPTIAASSPEPVGLVPSLVPTVFLEPSSTTSPGSQRSLPSTEKISLSPVIIVSSVPISFVPTAAPVSFAPLAPTLSSAPVTSAPIDPSESSSALTDVMMTTSAPISSSPSATSIPTSLELNLIPSLFPSVSPSYFPTSDVPSYSETPSGVTTSISQTPSALAEIATEIPTQHSSIVPSSLSSKIPIEIPSSLPSRHPSHGPSSLPIPSDIPSGSPSKFPPSTSKPTLRTNVSNMANLLLHIDGLPSLIGDDISLWESITGKHVMTYWNNISFHSIHISTVQTKIRDQMTVSNRRRLQNGTELQTGFVYNQQITYKRLGTRMPREGDLFFLPFEKDGGQEYATRLQQLDAYDPRYPITVVSLSMLTLAPSATPSTSTPTAPPSSSGIDVEKVIIAAVASILGGLFVIAGAICYRSRVPESSTATSIPTPPIFVNDDESTTREVPMSVLRKNAPLLEDGEYLGEDNDSDMEPYSMSCESPLLGVEFSQSSDSPFKVQELTPAASVPAGFTTSIFSPATDDYGLILEKWSRSMDQDTVNVKDGVYDGGTPTFSNTLSPSSGFKMEIEEIE